MHFWRSRGSILHKLSKILLSGKSTYGSRETELYSGARRMFRESTMCLQIIHYIYATKGEITGMIAPAMVIVSIQVATEFAPEGCDYLVWRASQYFQNMLWSVSRLKDLVSQAIRFLHPIICLRILANKQVNLDWRWNCLPKRGQIIFSRMAAQFNVSFRSALICSLYNEAGRNKRMDRPILKIFLPGFRIQSEILTDFRILQLQRMEDSSIFWARILNFANNSNIFAWISDSGRKWKGGFG